MADTLLQTLPTAPAVDPLDQIEWTHRLAFSSSNVRAGVRGNDAALWPRIVECLPPDATPTTSPVDHWFSIASEATSLAASPPRGYALYDARRPVIRTDDVDALVALLESAVRLRVAMSSLTHVFVHAGVVGWRGRGLVIPGASWSGKSELVAALVRAGATYYSDEYAVFDENGRVRPYARPIALRNPNGTPKRRVHAGELGGVAGADALPVGSVLVTRFAPGATWRPRRLSGGEAVLALLAHTVRARLDPPLVLQRLSRAAREAAAYEGVRGEADAAAAAILGEPTRVTHPWAPAPVDADRSGCSFRSTIIQEGRT